MLHTANMRQVTFVGEKSTETKAEAQIFEQLTPGAADVKPLLPAGVVLQSLVYGTTSAAEEGRAQTMLARTGIPVCLVPADSPDDSSCLLSASARQELERLTHPRLDLARSILFNATAPPTWNLDYRGRYRVGRAMFWTDRIPTRWVEPCNAMDEVWVPSHFNRETFVASGVAPEKVRVLPPGVDTKLFRPGRVPLRIPHLRGFNFLCVTNLHDRKGTELLLQAFLQEFKTDDDIALVLKVSPQKDNPIDFEAELAFFIEKQASLLLEKSPTVIFIDEFLPQSEMPSLYAAADAFVLPTHGEGCGRVLLEALASELPVITTRWGGPLEFLNDEISYLIDIEGLVPVPLGEPVVAGHLWASPSLDHLRQLMREVYVNAEEARKRSQKGRQKIAQNWDWSAVFPRWEQEFRRLLG